MQGRYRILLLSSEHKIHARHTMTASVRTHCSTAVNLKGGAVPRVSAYIDQNNRMRKCREDVDSESQGRRRVCEEGAEAQEEVGR